MTNPLTKKETRVIDELWHLRDVDRKKGTDTQRHIERRRELTKWLKKRRDRLSALALAAGGGVKRNWRPRHRGSRFQIIHKAILFKKGGRVPHDAGDVGSRAVAAGRKYVGLHEVGYNDAPWLRRVEAFLVRVGHALAWMIPGNPYCGMGVIFMWQAGPGIFLPDNWVGTTNILPSAGSVVRDKHGRKFLLMRISLDQVRIGDPLVFNFGSGGAKHTGVARGHMSNGMIPTREWNTSAGNGGSQSNGGGVYDRWRSRGLIMGALRIKEIK